MTTTDKHIAKRVGRNVISGVPRISVVIPAFNCADTVADAIRSAIDQKYKEHEIIVVNDGSPDTAALERALHIYRDDIIYIRQRNAGAGPARNLGVEHARGELVAFLDADDTWLPEYLASQYVFIGRNSLDMAYCDAWLTGTNSPVRRTFMQGAPSSGECDFNAILDLRCNVITSGTVVKRELVIAVDGFETERVRAHDFHLWLRLAKAGARIGYQRKQLLKYRVGSSGLSGDSIARVERERDAYQRVARTIALDTEQKQIVDRRIRGLEADLAVEQGKAFLLARDYAEAAVAFRVANRHRRSLKLLCVAWLARLAPQTLLKYFRQHRADDLNLIRRQL